MADELHSFLDILADVAKQQEEDENNQGTTPENGERTVEESDAGTPATPQKPAEEQKSAPSPIVIPEDDDPDFFKSTVSSVRKNSRNTAKKGGNGEISIFDQTKKRTGTGRTSSKTASSRTTARRKSSSTGTSARRRSGTSRSSGFRMPRSSSIIKMILKALIDMLFGKKGRSSAKKSNLTGTDMLNLLLGENTSSTGTANFSSEKSVQAQTSDKLLSSVVKSLFGNGKSANAGYLPIFRKIVRSMLEADRTAALNDTSSFTKEASGLGYSARESAEASKILEGLLNSGLSNESITAVLEQFSDTDD